MKITLGRLWPPKEQPQNPHGALTPGMEGGPMEQCREHVACIIPSSQSSLAPGGVFWRNFTQWWEKGEQENPSKSCHHCGGWPILLPWTPTVLTSAEPSWWCCLGSLPLSLLPSAGLSLHETCLQEPPHYCLLFSETLPSIGQELPMLRSLSPRSQVPALPHHHEDKLGCSCLQPES